MSDKLQIEFGGRNLIVETNRLAKQADAAVLVCYGETVVLSTVVISPDPQKEIDFLPLVVDYRERAYAAGRIPGGYFKREGRPGDKETLTARLIDRPIRPLFPEGLRNEIHIVSMALSADLENDPDILAMLGSSAALTLSGAPFYGPIGAVRIGYVNGNFVLNPVYKEIENSRIDLVVAGTKNGVTMLEGDLDEVDQGLLLDAVDFGYSHLQKLIELQEELKRIAGKPPMQLPLFIVSDELYSEVRQKIEQKLKEAIIICGKKRRQSAMHNILNELLQDYPEEEQKALVRTAFSQLYRELVRNYIITRGIRLDGRKYDEIRPISCEVSVLPRTHGSALFTRGETQALVIATLGTVSDEQKIDDLEGETTKTFMLHYNFPPFSVGETGALKAPGRREIGHGMLAERALARQIPPDVHFPYTIRVVSDILESNGSSSMATVCGSSLALMDAGVKIKTNVAGIAMGLIKNGDEYIVLSDIEGSEDHCGDMDLKLAGTKNGFTVVQMDIKIGFITREILQRALAQAEKGLWIILDKMNNTISRPRDEISPYAPRILTMKIHPDKIRDVIGPGGKIIRKIIDETGVKIDIEPDGTVFVASVNLENANKAKQMIEHLSAVPEVGQVYNGVVKRVESYGVFVEILPNTEGLLHISQMEDPRVRNAWDIFHVGDKITARLIEIDELGRLKLSQRDLPSSSKTNKIGADKSRNCNFQRKDFKKYTNFDRRNHDKGEKRRY